MRVSTSPAPATQNRSLARRCRVPGEPDDSKTAQDRLPSFATNEGDSRRIILVINVTSKRNQPPLTSVLSPRAGRGGRRVSTSLLCLRDNLRCVSHARDRYEEEEEEIKFSQARGFRPRRDHVPNRDCHRGNFRAYEATQILDGEFTFWRHRLRLLVLAAVAR